MPEQETLEITVGCKVNLHLVLTARLDNGYHTLESLFVPLPKPNDTLTLCFGAREGGFTLTANDPALAGESNTVTRAYHAYAAKTGFAPELSAHLEKRIPTGAGLGGGSADAAALLRALNDRAGNRALKEEDLYEVAKEIGADVPFFLLNAAAWAEGIGERLAPVDIDFSGLFLVLLCPTVHVSTAWAYAAWDAAPSIPALHAETRHGFLTCGQDQFKSSPCSCLALINSFEDVVFPEHPILREYKEKLITLGACGAVMSGSGASLLGLFRDEAQAKRCVESFQKEGLPTFLHRF